MYSWENAHNKFPIVLTAMMATPTAEYFEKLLSALLSIIPVISGISGLDNGKLELLHQWMIDVLKTTSKSYPGLDYVFLIFSQFSQILSRQGKVSNVFLCVTEN